MEDNVGPEGRKQAIDLLTARSATGFLYQCLPLKWIFCWAKQSSRGTAFDPTTKVRWSFRESSPVIGQSLINCYDYRISHSFLAKIRKRVM